MTAYKFPALVHHMTPSDVPSTPNLNTPLDTALDEMMAWLAPRLGIEWELPRFQTTYLQSELGREHFSLNVGAAVKATLKRAYLWDVTTSHLVLLRGFGGFAGTYIGDKLAVLSDYCLLTIAGLETFTSDNGVDYSRDSQIGSIVHELGHAWLNSAEHTPDTFMANPHSYPSVNINAAQKRTLVEFIKGNQW